MTMPSILELIQSNDVRRFSTGEVIIEQDGKTNILWFLVEGGVEVLKDGVRVAMERQPGAVFGELSALLGVNHTATVRALQPCVFRVVENPRAFLESSPLVCLHISELLARRLVHLNRYLVDVKQQFEGDDHLSMIDNVLETLMHRQPDKRIRPEESTIKEAELSD